MKQRTTSYAITDKRILKKNNFSESLGNFRKFRFLDQDIEIPALLILVGESIIFFTYKDKKIKIVTIEDEIMNQIVLLIFKNLWQRIEKT